MSTTSSRSSEISVSYNGNEMSLEEALDRCMREVQNYMNHLQSSMRQLAALDEQEIGDELFQEATRVDLEVQELVDNIHESTNELSEISEQIRGKPPSPAAKKWFAEHRRALKDRKQKEAAAKAAKKEAEKAAVASAKLASVAEK
jgi:hypothetical protein